MVLTENFVIRTQGTSIAKNLIVLRNNVLLPSSKQARDGMTVRKIGRAFYFLATLTLAFCSCQLSRAAVRIGAESAITVPSNAWYSTVVNLRPGNNETVYDNPPIFSWFYHTNHLAGGEMNGNGFRNTVYEQTNAFRLQIATQPDFSPLAIVFETNTPVNFYNFLAPLDTSITRKFWWRVKYVTNGVPWFTNAIQTFTIANGATNWDRSIFANPNYNATNGVHPIFCFRSGEESGIWNWEKNHPDFASILNMAGTVTQSAWFTSHTQWATNSNPNPNFAAVGPPGVFDRITGLGALLNLWKFSDDPRWTNPSMTGWLITNLQHFVNWHNHISNNIAITDFGQPAGSMETPRLLAATYDWLYDYLGSDTSTFNGQLRTNALLGLHRTMLWYNHTTFWRDAQSGSGLVSNVWQVGWRLPQNNPEGSTWPCLTKMGISHGIMDVHAIMPLAAVIQRANESSEGAFAHYWMLNYMLARSSPYAGFAAHHVGPYGYTDNHTYPAMMFSAFMHFEQTDPDAHLERTDFCRRFPDWWTRMNPYYMRHYQGPYGDGSVASKGNHSGALGDKARGWDLAAISGSGLAIQAYNLNAEFSAPAAQAQWWQLPLRYHFRYTPAPQTNTTSAVYPEDGYVIASQKSPSEFDCYTNGVGFSFQARPRGTTAGHDTFSDLSFDLWAYGTELTGGGGNGLDPYAYVSDSSPTLFVNGYGYSGNRGNGLYGYSPTIPVHASICNFKSSGTDFVYACADGTGLFTNAYHPLNTLVKKVKRHVLFVRSKYWVVHDEFEATSPSTFAFRWLVPWVFRYDVTDNTLANEVLTSRPHLIGSNSLAMGTNGFAYVAGNYADAGFQNPPRVPVHVQFANATNTYGVFNARGINNLGGGGTGVIGTSSTNSTLNPFLNRTYPTLNPDRAVGMWVTNRFPSTQWSLTTVIVPQQPGVAAPVFQRIDNNTIVVTYDGVTETNTFGTNYTGAATFIVDLAGRSALSAPTYRGGPPVIHP
jgi:hypothetical protein